MHSVRCDSRVKSLKKKKKKDPERITKIKSFINKYNWKQINFPSEKDNLKEKKVKKK